MVRDETEEAGILMFGMLILLIGIVVFLTRADDFLTKVNVVALKLKDMVELLL